MEPIAFIRKQLEEAEPDLLRDLLHDVVDRIMASEVDGLAGAGHGERSPERTNRRNGYRGRRFDTRLGTLDLRIPKLRAGSYFPDWLLEPRRRSERALTQVIAEAYVLGVSTRRVDALVQALGITGMSKSQVSELAKCLDADVASFRGRPLDGGPYRHLQADALAIKVREGGRIVQAAALVATGVNRDGHREILGLEVVTQEDGAAWLSFFRGLVARGLAGVALVTSDAHVGLREAIAAVLPGAAWQRCRTHFMRNLLTRVPKSAQPFVATMVRTIFTQPDARTTRHQHAVAVAELTARFPEAAALLAEAREELLAFSHFDPEHWRQIWSTNPQERLNRELRRRSDVVGIFPNRSSIIRLIGAVLAEQHDEWQVAHRYMSLDYLAKPLITIADEETLKMLEVASYG
jgi:transposase-like protein